LLLSKRYSPLLMLLIFASANSAPLRAWADDKPTGPVVKSADGKLQLNLPAHWESHDFHLDAVKIGAAREKAGEYVEIIADPRDQYVDNLAQYADGKVETMVILLEGVKVTSDGPMDIHGRNSIRFEIEGRLPDSGVKIGYVLTIIETKDFYIQVIAWSAGNTFADHRGELQDLAGDFSLVGDTE
jgi:hypothetical protein